MFVVANDLQNRMHEENKMVMRKIVMVAVIFITTMPVSAQIKYGLRDETGRHVIARGFVVNTNDGNGELVFTTDDYVRMVRMGANFQVVRLELKKLSAFPGCRLDKDYLRKLDSLVRMGKHAGIKTVFKMTV